MPEVRYEVVDGVAVVTLDAPRRRNSLTPGMVAELVAALDRADSDESVGAMVISGGESFCSGADLSVIAETEPDPAQDLNFRAIEDIYQAFIRVGDVKVPTIAAVRGAAVGAGLNLALAPDVRVVARDARLLSGFTRIGAHPGGGHFVLLQRAAGREAAAAMGVFGAEIDGVRAAEIGLAWRAADDAEVEAVAFELARHAAGDPALAKRVVSSFRSETAHGGLDWRIGVEVERAPQMWSFRRRGAR